MKPNQRAKKIAAILYDTAGGEAIQVHTSLQHIGDLIKKDAQLKSLFQSKRIHNDKKIQIIREVFSNFFHVLAVEFLGLMVKDRSIHIIRQVIKAYSDLYKEKAGTINVHAHVSQEMEVAYINALQENLKSTINKNVDFKIEVDNDLLGGIKLRIENMFLDASLKSKLNRLQSKLLQS
jgi:F-type H+-transporting ATPase subunit delta